MNDELNTIEHNFITPDFCERKTAGIYSRKKKALDDSSAYISPMLNNAELMTHLEIQGGPDDSYTDYDIAIRSKKLLFHKAAPLLIIRILLQTTPRI